MILLMELPQEYWRHRTLFEIASAIGTPLSLDESTKNRVFGHYALILVDMDLSRRVFDEIMVERDGYTFNLEVVYERLPDVCSHCKVIGLNILTSRVKETQASTSTAIVTPAPVLVVPPQNYSDNNDAPVKIVQQHDNKTYEIPLHIVQQQENIITSMLDNGIAPVTVPTIEQHEHIVMENSHVAERIT
ncbi:NBS resistance protein, partial [Trifolium medium]|nr:NBS resistance protein [Trifolium medium]